MYNVYCTTYNVHACRLYILNLLFKIRKYMYNVYYIHWDHYINNSDPKLI